MSDVLYQGEQMGASTGVKADTGKLATHLLAPEIFSASAAFAPESCHEQAIEALALWWARRDDRGLAYAFAFMLNALNKELGDVNGNDSTCARAIEAITRVLEFGANKYAPRNWEKGIVYSRCYGAVLRHWLAVGRGEALDAETFQHHFAHACCELMFLVAYEARGMGAQLDDRPGAPEAA